MATGTSEVVRGRNRLAKEKSPYLLQHASNPVDWYPWGEEAFSKARSEDKPIFLSVGYSTCHWCHVMERESFESEEIGKLLNENFVSIKVDREERPDVDRVYMTFVQATQGGGGWPMSVFMTPDLKPFLGGTYFPPADKYGRPGFSTLLRTIAHQWKANRHRLADQGTKIMDAISKAIDRDDTGELRGVPGLGCTQRAYEMFNSQFDDKFGGFGEAPKFPQPAILNFLLHVNARYPSSPMGERALEIVCFTLKAMANGGIHDHIGQGFHRYSTDQFWHVPHFEKMLYDQAQLAAVYSTAYQITRASVFAEVTRDILLYVSRDLSDEDGGFYSAEDADSLPVEGGGHKKEGAFCVWTQQEINSLLPDVLHTNPSVTLADLFSYHYGAEAKGNVDPHKDPHGELKGQNVLIVRGSLEDTAGHFSLDVGEVRDLLAKCRAVLYLQRQKRPKPHRDDKILTAWNGLMITGFSRASQALGDHMYLDRAVKAAQFIKDHLYDPKKGVLVRNGYRDAGGVLRVGEVEGFADDYAFLIRGLLDLYETGYDQQWLEWAVNLQSKQDELFWDEKKGGYFSSTSSDSNILLRMKEDQDGAEPNPNSVSAQNLWRLAAFLDKQDYKDRSAKVLTAFSSQLNEHPMALSEMLCALINHYQSPKQIIIVGEKESSDLDAMVRCAQYPYFPNKVTIVHHPGEQSYLTQHLTSLSSMQLQNKKAVAHVCENYVCMQPISDIGQLTQILDVRKKV